MENKSVEPVTDEISRVSILTGLQAERGLNTGERTGRSNRHLNAYQRNRCQVQQAEAGISHPLPIVSGANKDRREADNDKDDIDRMECRDSVGRQDPQRCRKLPLRA